MSLLSLVGVGKYFGARTIFEGVSFTLARGEKVGLVGRNGVGKTTLMRIIAGDMEPDAGFIGIPKSAKVGILSQDTDFSSRKTVYEEMLDVFADLLSIKGEMAVLERSMSDDGVHGDPEKLKTVMEEYSVKAANFERLGGYMLDTRIKTVVYGLGFAEDALDRRVCDFSGGERVRLGLAKLLLSEPSLLLLDEPTNHLDLKSVEWLEEYMKTFAGAVLVVSHDRYFLDMVADKIIELEHRQATVYPGNYSAYAGIKEDRTQVRQAAYERQQEEIEKSQRFIDKWKAGTRSTLAKSREKMLAKMEIVDAPHNPGRAAHFRFETAVKSGKEVVKFRDLTKSYGERTLFKPFSLIVERGDRVGLIGRNGTGKSTILKMLLGAVEPTKGSVELGKDVEIGYFSQEMDNLNPANTVLEEVESACGLLRERVRTLLGAFLFTGEEVFKPIAVLSGGEKNRVVLAKLLVGKANLLVLDEPTNHLDLSSKDALESALNEYTGTMLLVSHDRYFLDKVATMIVEIEDGKVSVFEGNYSFYREKKAELAARLAADQQDSLRSKQGQGAQGQISRDLSDRQSDRQSERQKKKWLAVKVELEGQIEAEEARMLRLEATLADPELYSDAERSRSVIDEHARCKELVEELYSRWEEVIQTIERC